MAAINFPDSPNLNDFHVANGRRWQWNGTAWQRIPDPGAQGVQGADGAQGNQGATGNQGNQGATGNQGNQGATGNQGNQGAPGNQGNQGATGNQGNQGATGNQGDPGSGGLQGAQGNQGAPGNQGADGNFGGATFDYTFTNSTSGDPGAGQLGFNNATLSSATQLNIDDTDDNSTDIQPFLRTIDDSTSTIKGHFRVSNRLNADDFALFTISSVTEQAGHFEVSCAFVSGSASSFSNGEDVIITFARTGDKGDQGAQGDPGSGGLQGAQGNQGATGNQGNQGATGNQGNQGATGNQGNQGATGNQGNQGATGNQGDPGSGGLQGAQGAQGAPGNQGNQGAPGNQGNQGAPGTEGAQGGSGDSFWRKETYGSNTGITSTSNAVGINTTTINDPDVVGIGNSFQGVYISNGMVVMDNTLNGNHYIGTAFNGLMAGPVVVNGSLTIDGVWVVV